MLLFFEGLSPLLKKGWLLRLFKCDAKPIFKQSYAPQSGEIFAILTQMLETFEANLSQSQKEEMENQKACEDLKAAKEAEIAAGQEQIDNNC